MKYSSWAALLSLSIVLVFSFAACNKDDNNDFRKDKSIEGQFRGTVKFTTTHLYKTFPSIDSTARYAKVSLYKTLQDMNLDKSKVMSGTSDSTGFLAFYQLPDSVYYYKATYRGIEEEERIELNGEINFVEVVFVKP